MEIQALENSSQGFFKGLEMLNYTVNSLLLNLSTLNVRLGTVEEELSNLSLSYSLLANKLLDLEENLSKHVCLYQDLLKNYTTLQQEHQQLLKNYTELLAENKHLEEELELKHNESEEYSKKLADQLSEIVYARSFKVYNYRQDLYKEIELKIAAQDYLSYRLNVTREHAVIEDRIEQLKAMFTVFITYDDKYIIQIAQELRELAGNNDELYANLVLQLVHQIKYMRTLYCKYPLETIVEGVGDCDNLAVLAASIMKAGGLDVVLILCKVSLDGVSFSAHAMVGLALDSEPKMPVSYGRTPQYVGYEGKFYYLCECTYSSDASPWDFKVRGSLVGDNPWKVINDIIILPT